MVWARCGVRKEGIFPSEGGRMMGGALVDCEAGEIWVEVNKTRLTVGRTAAAIVNRLGRITPRRGLAGPEKFGKQKISLPGVLFVDECIWCTSYNCLASLARLRNASIETSFMS
jgi:hypothetical protein